MACDAGLQVERTALAWRRTTLALVVTALLLLRAGIFGAGLVLASIGLLVLVAAGLTHLFVEMRCSLSADPRQFAAAPGLLLIGIATLTSLCSLGALFAAFAR